MLISNSPDVVSFRWLPFTLFLFSNFPFNCYLSIGCSILFLESLWFLSIMVFLRSDSSANNIWYFRFNSACSVSILVTFSSSSFSSGICFFVRYLEHQTIFFVFLSNSADYDTYVVFSGCNTVSECSVDLLFMFRQVRRPFESIATVKFSTGYSKYTLLVGFCLIKSFVRMRNPNQTFK